MDDVANCLSCRFRGHTCAVVQPDHWDKRLCHVSHCLSNRVQLCTKSHATTERSLFCCSPCSLTRGWTSLSWPQLYLACWIWLRKPPVIQHYVPDQEIKARKNIGQITQACKKLFTMQMLRQMKVMVTEENLKFIFEFKETCQYFASW